MGLGFRHIHARLGQARSSELDLPCAKWSPCGASQLMGLALDGGLLASGLGFRLGFRVEGLGWYSSGIWS